MLRLWNLRSAACCLSLIWFPAVIPVATGQQDTRPWWQQDASNLIVAASGAMKPESLAAHLDALGTQSEFYAQMKDRLQASLDDLEGQAEQLRRSKADIAAQGMESSPEIVLQLLLHTLQRQQETRWELATEQEQVKLLQEQPAENSDLSAGEIRILEQELRVREVEVDQIREEVARIRKLSEKALVSEGEVRRAEAKLALAEQQAAVGRVQLEATVADRRARAQMPLAESLRNVARMHKQDELLAREAAELQEHLRRVRGIEEMNDRLNRLGARRDRLEERLQELELQQSELNVWRHMLEQAQAKAKKQEQP